MNNQKYNYIYDKIPLGVSTIEMDETERKIISYIAAATERLIKKKSADYYILLASKFCRKAFGRKYGAKLNRLLSLSVLKRKALGKTKQGKKLFCLRKKAKATSYKLNNRLICDVMAGKYTRNIIKVPWVSNPKSQSRRAVVLSGSNSPLLNKLVENYNGLSILPEWQTDNEIDFHAWSSGKGYVKQINSKRIKASIGESGRIFHPLICMSRIIRKYARHNDEELCAIDGKAFHPHLLATFLNESSRQEYLDYLRGCDIYGMFMPEHFENADDERSIVKHMYQIFLGDENPRGIALEIHSWYAANFPNIIEAKNRIQKAGGTVQMTLQKIESSIFIENVFAKARFWCLPMHDGLAVKSDDRIEAAELCYNEIKKKVGFPISVTIKP